MKVVQTLAIPLTALSVTCAYEFSSTMTTKSTPSDSTEKSTGLSTNQEMHIYGGSDANVHDYPYIASIRFQDQDKIFCGGTLIAPQYVLTAGHCVKNNKGAIMVHLSTKSSSASIDQADEVQVVQGFQHPLYDKKKHLYDVGLLKLETPATQKLATLCALDGSDNRVGTEATVLGWGMTEEGSHSDVLQEVTVAVISNAECNKQYANRITEGMMCAGNGGGKDSCNGDSGGPLVTRDDILIGFVSWGGKCGVNAGVYTRLTYVMDYINDILNGGDGSSFTNNSSSERPPSSTVQSADEDSAVQNALPTGDTPSDTPSMTPAPSLSPAAVDQAPASLSGCKARKSKTKTSEDVSRVPAKKTTKQVKQTEETEGTRAPTTASKKPGKQTKAKTEDTDHTRVKKSKEKSSAIEQNDAYDDDDDDK
ncbi:hypothetical protein PsorP6_009258 [Peronosclerospora sorghi]|uniref:Uncharacterized protein n=1 Tax=Peronosclerospora sorghi TaxID=230839 RepID=A0ACC0W067_9STRA|nr:hypothetical protein PsorP6_009258 [Peronosclerospora sorghi]